MKAVSYLLPVLSLLLLGAHFFRDGAVLLTLACVALAGLLAWRRPWVPRVIQAALVLGALEWAWTAFLLVQERMAIGRPWGRLAVILGVVALVTVASAVLLERLRGGYRRAP